MAFTKGHQSFEQKFTQIDRDRMWELYFGKRWSLTHIGNEYGVNFERIASIIDTESQRQWLKAHPNETNSERLLLE